jgi:hypothetical protein
MRPPDYYRDSIPVWDFSDELAYLSILIDILTDVAPNGRWITLPLYQRWSKGYLHRGPFSYRELCQLTEQLVTELAAIDSTKLLPPAPTRHHPEDDAPPQDSNLQTVDR